MGRTVKESKKYLEPFVIYVFRSDDTYFAIGRAKKKGIDENYAYGFKIEADPKANNNALMFQEKRAKRDVITRVSNCLNAINLYGKDAMDRDGNISWALFQQCETKAAYGLNKKAKIVIPLQTKYPLHTFKIREIKYETAIEQGLLEL